MINIAEIWQDIKWMIWLKLCVCVCMCVDITFVPDKGWLDSNIVIYVLS